MVDSLDGSYISDPESSKGTIEMHMENIIKMDYDMWIGYKKRLLQLLTTLKELETQTSISVYEGDSYVRFKSSSNYTTLNSLFLVYEIGKVFPMLMWRHLIGYGGAFNYVLLNRTVSVLPAFSFSFDQQVTLLYWGEQVPYLSTEQLRNFKLTNFIIKSNNPSSTEVSASNICWPKSAYPFPMDQRVEQLVKYYLFNSLMPPVLDNISEVWFENPFLLIGDKTVRLLTIHKTLCFIDEKTVKRIQERKTVNAKAYIIDRSFNSRRITVDVPDECIDQLINKESSHEVIFVKDVKLKHYPTVIAQKPDIRYTVYPFESIKVFGNESYGPLVSLASMVLRDNYLKTSDPFYFTITPLELKKYLTKILTQFPYFKPNELGLKLVESKGGLDTLLSLLEVYISDGHSILYLHPSLLEWLLSYLKVTVDKSSLIRLQRIAYRYCQEADFSSPLQSVFLIQNLFEKEFGFVPKHSEAKCFTQSLYNVVKLCIPLSKSFGSWSGVTSHA